MAKKKRKLSSIQPRPKKEYHARGKRGKIQKAKIQKVIAQSVQQDKIPEVKPINPNTPLDNINRTMDYIRNNPNLNRDDMLGHQLKSVMDLLTGDNKIRYKAGEDYGFFEIDSSWDGKRSSLIGHVTFKDLDNNADAMEYLNDIANSKWGDEARHQQFLQEKRHQAFSTNIKSLSLPSIDSQSLELIEQIMNSSDMWQIIVEDKGATGMKNYKKSYESEQVGKAWDNTVVVLSDVLKEGVKNNKLKRGDLDTLMRMIRNHDDFKSIVAYINKLLEEYRK